jgi:para-aminobenzoate synthetase component 1
LKLFIKEREKQQIYNHLMRRTATHFNIQETPFVKEQILNWAQKFETIVWLDSNNHKGKHAAYEGVLAVGVQNELLSSATNAFEQLKTFQSKYNDYLFGFLTYDLKNDVEKLTSENLDQLDFPELYFFQPQKLIFVSKGRLTFKYLGGI